MGNINVPLGHEFADLKCSYDDMVNSVIEGVGKNAEVVINDKGGKQSKAPMAMHLVDPKFLKEFAYNKANTLEYEDEGESICIDDDNIAAHSCYKAIENIADFMLTGIDFNLQIAMDCLVPDELQQVITIAKVLQYGAERYEPNNWRLIPQEEHLNHALIHIIAELSGDNQDEHREHALCRLMMALATKQSEDFSYTKYITKNS